MNKTYVITKPVSFTDASDSLRNGREKKSIIVTVQEIGKNNKNTAAKIIKFKLDVEEIRRNLTQSESFKFEGLCITRKCRFIGYFYNNQGRNKKEHGRLVLFSMFSVPPPSSALPSSRDNGR